MTPNASARTAWWAGWATATSVSDPKGPVPATALPGDAATTARRGSTGAPPARKRGGSRRWLIGAGVAVAVATVLVGGTVLGQRLGGAEESNGGNEAADSGSDNGPDDLQPQEIPEFTEDYAGDWEGLTEDGYLYTAEIDEGERTVAMNNEDNDDCTYRLHLTERNEGGYAGTFEDSVGYCDPPAEGDIRMERVDEFVLVELSGEDDDLQIQLQPAE